MQVPNFHARIRRTAYFLRPSYFEQRTAVHQVDRSRA